MKKTTTFGVRFFIKTYKVKDGRAPIYVRITVGTKPSPLLVLRVRGDRGFTNKQDER
jgi:hypothetical protein